MNKLQAAKKLADEIRTSFDAQKLKELCCFIDCLYAESSEQQLRQANKMIDAMVQEQQKKNFEDVTMPRFDFRVAE